MYLLSEHFDLFDAVVSQFNSNLTAYGKFSGTSLDGLSVNLKTGKMSVYTGKADKNIIDFTYF